MKRKKQIMTKGLTILFLLMASFHIAYAQFTISSISLHKSPSSTWLSYRFPIVRSNDKAAAQNVNSLLQQKVLENDHVLVDSNKIFENSRYISNDSIHQSGYSEIDYAVLVNNARVLTLEFDMESTGAYSTDFPLYYSFDSRTGKEIFFDALFKAGARPIIQKRILEERKRRVAEFIKKEYESSEDSSFIRERYDECLSEDDLEHIYIKSNSVVFYKAYCFPHVARPYDTDLDVEMKLNEIGPLLTAYGRMIFHAN